MRRCPVATPFYSDAVSFQLKRWDLCLRSTARPARDPDKFCDMLAPGVSLGLQLRTHNWYSGNGEMCSDLFLVFARHKHGWPIFASLSLTNSDFSLLPSNSHPPLFCVTFTAASLSVAAWLFAPYDSWIPFHSFRRSFSSHPHLSTRTAASQRYKSITQLIHHTPSDFVSRPPYPSSSTSVGRSVSHATVSPSIQHVTRSELRRLSATLRTKPAAPYPLSQRLRNTGIQLPSSLLAGIAPASLLCALIANLSAAIPHSCPAERDCSSAALPPHN